MCTDAMVSDIIQYDGEGCCNMSRSYNTMIAFDQDIAMALIFNLMNFDLTTLILIISSC